MSEKKSVIQAFRGWGVVILMVLGFAAVLAYERWQRQGPARNRQRAWSQRHCRGQQALSNARAHRRHRRGR